MDNAGSGENFTNVNLSKEMKGAAGQLIKISEEGDYVHLAFAASEKGMGHVPEFQEDLLIIQWDASEGLDYQQWKLTKVGDNTFIISPRKSDKRALTYRKDGKLQLEDRNESEPAQQWVIKKTNEKLPKEKNLVGKENWENEQIFAINKENGRNTFPVFFTTQVPTLHSRSWIPHFRY